MNMENMKQRALLSWASVGLMALVACVLAVLQYRWIGEVSVAERDRMRDALQTALTRFSQDFNTELANAISLLRPPSQQIEELGRETAYLNGFARLQESGRQAKLFRRIALGVPQQKTVQLQMLDPAGQGFAEAQWPAAWAGLRDRMESRLSDSPRPPFDFDDPALLEIPRFSRIPTPGGDDRRTGPPRASEQEWLILEVDLDYLRSTFIPELLQRHLGLLGQQEFDVEIYSRFNASSLLYHTRQDTSKRLDPAESASATLFEMPRWEMGRAFTRRGETGGEAKGRPARQSPWAGRPGEGRGGPQGMDFGGEPGSEGKGRQSRKSPWFARKGEDKGGPPGMDFGRGRWQILANHRSGSLDALVARTRRRNLAISAALLVLMLGTAAALVRYSRQAEQLAELQMNFVAGVSHELRTPLTVIRTAAYNLKGRVAGNPSQVERYGTLIQDESEKLSAIVDQVLRFANARAGRVIREREPVAVENVLESGVRSSRVAVEGTRLILEKNVQEGLPLVMADELALQQVIQNLLDNAVKYGTESSNWIGLSATRAADGTAVEIRVADHGPGIPRDEQSRIFDAFYRGSRAIRDQIHGTGLGLNLVKKIVEAHDGAIRVVSEPNKGTEFIVRIPVAPPELQDEFAHSTG